MNKFIPALVLGCVGVLGVAGCAVEPGSASAPAGGDAPADAREGQGEATATSEAALVSNGGGGGGLGYSCSAIGCICWGDFDCNNMFTDGVCGDRPAKCWERGPGPVYCTCYARSATAPSRATTLGGAATATMLAQ